MEAAAKCIDARMRRLAQQDHVDVMEYVYDRQEREADAVNAVKMATVVAERRRALGALSDAEAAARLQDEDANVATFARSFPTIFRHALDMHDGARHLDVLKVLARIRKEVEARSMTEAEANVHATRVILERTMRAPTDEDRVSMKLN